MRAVLVLVCLSLAGCSVSPFNRGAKEVPEREVAEAPAKREPREKPSDVLKAPRKQLASPVSDYFYVRGGVIPSTVATQLRLDPNLTTQGTLLTLEDDLAFDDKPVLGNLEFSLRMRERNRLRVNFLQLDRNEVTNLVRAIDFGDEQFDAGDRVRGLFDFRMITLTYTYSVFRGERYEFGAGIGGHAIVSEARATAPGRLPGDPPRRELETGNAAFATVAADGAFRISKRWALTARGQYFSTKIRDVDGTLSDYHIDAQYRWRKNVAVGLGYSATKFEVISTDDSFPGLFNLDVKGPELFLRIAF